MKKNEGTYKVHHQMDQNVHHWGSRRRKNEREEAENLFKEKMTENIPNLGKETDMQIQEAQRVLNKMNPKQHTLRNNAEFSRKTKAEGVH